MCHGDRSSRQNISYVARSNLGRIVIGWIRIDKGRPQRARNYCFARFEFLFLCFGLLLMNGSNYLLKVVFPCRGENCKKSFSKKSNRNKHEKLKNMDHNFRKKFPVLWQSLQQMAVMLSSNMNIALLNI